jgi:DNA-directed RNA polymerase specialized sigma24 family protein
MQVSSANGSTIPGAPSAEVVRAAFRDLHGARLHGFALLLTLGDQAVAARLAADALAAAAISTADLSHPERAAAWLRRHVVRNARGQMRDSAAAAGRRRAALEGLGADAAAFASFAPLDLRERAVLAAYTVERLDRRDVATIVGMEGARLDRLIRHALSRAMESAGRVLDDDRGEGGPIMTSIRAIAERTMK